MEEYSPFHNPAHFGTFDIATTQVGKVFQFDWDTDVLAASKVVVVFMGRVIKRYSVGDGLEISEANRRIKLLLDGPDFANYVGQLVELQCNFFLAGDVDVVIRLKIVNSLL